MLEKMDRIGKLTDKDKRCVAQFNIEGVRIAFFEKGDSFFLYELHKDGNSIMPNGVELEESDVDTIEFLRKFVTSIKNRPDRPSI